VVAQLGIPDDQLVAVFGLRSLRMPELLVTPKPSQSMTEGEI
jgi:hypothetical protein